VGPAKFYDRGGLSSFRPIIGGPTLYAVNLFEPRVWVDSKDGRAGVYGGQFDCCALYSAGELAPSMAPPLGGYAGSSDGQRTGFGPSILEDPRRRESDECGCVGQLISIDFKPCVRQDDVHDVDYCSLSAIPDPAFREPVLV
jgi:hypothetical protein